MDQGFVELVTAFIVAMGGIKGMEKGWEKYQQHSGNSTGTKKAVEALEAKISPHMQKEVETLERIHDSMEKLLDTQYQTNNLLSEIKGRLAKGD